MKWKYWCLVSWRKDYNLTSEKFHCFFPFYFYFVTITNKKFFEKTPYKNVQGMWSRCIFLILIVWNKSLVIRVMKISVRVIYSTYLNVEEEEDEITHVSSTFRRKVGCSSSDRKSGVSGGENPSGNYKIMKKTLNAATHKKVHESKIFYILWSNHTKWKLKLTESI